MMKTENQAYIIAAKRSAVVPRNGAFRHLSLHELAKPVVLALLESATIGVDDVDYMLLGNALYGGGNPARLLALAAGLPEHKPALTIDSQCCAGLDAVILARHLVSCGAAEVVIAGGAESFSRAPRRFARSLTGNDDREYSRPPFSPWPGRDPDMIEAAAQLAIDNHLSRASQEKFARHSHQKARAAEVRLLAEIVNVAGVTRDLFTRDLKPELCTRLPILAGPPDSGLTSATIAVEADAAALLLVVSQRKVDKIQSSYFTPLRLEHTVAVGGSPDQPALATLDAIESLLARQHSMTIESIAVIELMEAFAAQAQLTIDKAGLLANRVNRGGGALARGHPIGASGAINLVRLCHEMQNESEGSCGLAVIAAAGGLASAAMVTKSARTC